MRPPVEIETEEPCELGGLPAHQVKFKSLSRHNPHAIYVDDCVSCQNEMAAGEVHFPRHFASDRCESNKRSHCSCDRCY